jgi:hypothetical protein
MANVIDTISTPIMETTGNTMSFLFERRTAALALISRQLFDIR